MAEIGKGKHRMIEKLNLTEKEIMFERGIYRIYDCGNIRWEYKL
jgi:hypothetical protein